MSNPLGKASKSPLGVRKPPRNQVSGLSKGLAERGRRATPLPNRGRRDLFSGNSPMALADRFGRPYLSASLVIAAATTAAVVETDH